MATLTLTGNADQLRLAFETTVGTLEQSNRTATVILDDTPSTGFVVKITGGDGVVRQY